MGTPSPCHDFSARPCCSQHCLSTSHWLVCVPLSCKKIASSLSTFKSPQFETPATGVSWVADGAWGPSLAQCSPDASSIHFTVSFHNLSRATGSLHKGALGTCSHACRTFSRPSSGLPMYPPLWPVGTENLASSQALQAQTLLVVCSFLDYMHSSVFETQLWASIITHGVS